MPRAQHIEDHGEAAIDLAPMLDFVLNLLIFFIITTSFVKEPGIQVDREQALTAEHRQTGNILIAAAVVGAENLALTPGSGAGAPALKVEQFDPVDETSTCTLQWGEVDTARRIVRRIPRKTARTGQPVIIGLPAFLAARAFLKYRRKDTLVLYALGHRRDYHHGFMVPSTGYLRWFALAPMGEGFAVRFPRRNAPNELPPLARR